MQVSVETTGTLERRMTIEVPAERVDEEVNSRLKNMARTARIDGFRPGKVPVSVVTRKYGGQVRKEVVDQVIRATLDEAMAQQQIEPAGQPNIEWPENTEAGQVLEYVVTFQVFPELAPVQFGDATVEKPVVEINEQDLLSVLDKLRKQRVVWETVDREAKMGDRLIISYTGTIDGNSFSGCQGVNSELELGSGSIAPGFDEQLVGATVGSRHTVKISYPDDYHVAEIAGKQASFDISVSSVTEPRLPELDDNLAHSFGIAEGGLPKFKEEVRINMARELEQALRFIMKERIFDIMLENNQIEVPTSLVKDEQMRMEISAGHSGSTQNELPTDFPKKAHRRVTLGMLLSKIAKDNNLQVDATRVRDMVDSVAASYENPDEVVAWYYDNPDRLSEAQTAVLEDQVVEWVLAQLETEDKPMTFEALMQLRQTFNA